MLLLRKLLWGDCGAALLAGVAVLSLSSWLGRVYPSEPAAPVRTVFDPADHAALRARLRELAPTTTPRWGRLSAPRMVCHVGDQLRCALGDVPATVRWTPFHNRALRFVVVHALPWPKGILPTAPEMLATQPTSWAEDVGTVEALLARIAARGEGGTWPAHPAFGPLGGREWGWLVYKHTDHHLRQFGV